MLAGLFNGLFLVFMAFNVFCQSIERLFEPVYVESESLLTISVLGLIVNIVGLVFFHDHAHGGHKGHKDCPVLEASNDEESGNPAPIIDGSI